MSLRVRQSTGERSLPDEASMKTPLLSREKERRKRMSNLIAQPDSPEASIRCQSSMSIFSRGVAINLTALKEPASLRAYPGLVGGFLERGS